MDRLAYVALCRAGSFERRTPSGPWEAWPLERLVGEGRLADPEAYLEYRRGKAPAFFFGPANRPGYAAWFARWDAGGGSPLEEAEDLAEGVMRYFAHRRVRAGYPPDWHANAVTGGRAPEDRHWSRVSDFGHGDIKLIWEPGRFSFAYALVRAYWRTGDERWAELFWQGVESWRQANPPHQGVHWKCGQEISFRVMAWCFGLYGFLDSPASTPARVAALAQMVAVSARRIEANLGYALSQKNNHGISEALGLWTAGILFPELRDAGRWRETGRAALERQGRELIYEDGAFSQHSVNYHRVMLHDFLWCLRLGDLHGEPFSAELRERVGRAVEFLWQIQDERTGRVPWYGQTDGALVLPLSNCDALDFRPVVQAGHYYRTGTRCWESGPWDEDLLWLFGPQAVEAPVEAPPRRELRAQAGGCHTLRASSGFAFVRCPVFRHRPGQADALHVDIWWRGQNVALDAGTYSYNAPAPWDNPLAHTAFHNTVTVDGLDQMERAGRFVWLPWLRATVQRECRSQAGHVAYWEGEHDGYARLRPPVTHRRAVVRLGEEHWVVLDRLESAGTHRYRLHWLLPDLPHTWNPDAGRLEADTPEGRYRVSLGTADGHGAVSLVRADPATPRGWRAPYYSERVPALSVDLTVEGAVARLWTVLGPGADVVADGDALRVAAGGWQASVRWGAGAGEPVATAIVMAGSVTDALRVAM